MNNIAHNAIYFNQVLIMTTYYAAQLGIALSVVDSKANYIQEEEKRIKLEQTGGSMLLDGQKATSIDDDAPVRHRAGRFNNKRTVYTWMGWLYNVLRIIRDPRWERV